MRRVMGFLLIVRGLSPFLFLAVLALAGLIILQDLRAEMERPLATIQREMDTLQTVVDDARTEFEDVQTNVNELISALDAFNPANFLPDLTGVIRIPSLTIPDVTIPIPDIPDGVSISYSSVSIAGVNLSYPSGISIATRDYTLAIPDIGAIDITIPGLAALGDALEAAFAPITEVFNVFKPMFASINALNETLQQIPESFSAIGESGEALIDGVNGVVTRWSQTLLMVMVVLGVLAVVYFGVPFLDSFTRGLRMVRGLPAD